MLSWQKIVNLLRKNNDKLVVFDSESGEAYVVLPHQQYEKLAGQVEGENDLSEEQLLDSINRDIETWQSSEEMEELIEQAEVKEESGDDYYYIEPVE
ncbi:hypothetical protein HN858_05375 [Candidatus Falkowbacteria bacterium]|jgi:hypothetical protein|nr:hypothetical protein [Candidatus Falkowbacteria bacterium]MBT5502984.1 hypothetical protein [Candidatus Falkowbacteria bacterium]MBT6574340.1 hypothetical protein [Candidatus Falkowbacteria bacterium]MBT7349067.1 hypothetical protein [Candidatus Falkowbacteria bacterium]MBT7500939.1 hypothetical protein [Candidatus Falkowbacteria bacterium]